MHKYKIGQRVRVKAPPLPKHKWGWREKYVGIITTVCNYEEKYYNLEGVVDWWGLPAMVEEELIAPVDDPGEETASWSTITKLLGTDIRKLRVTNDLS